LKPTEGCPLSDALQLTRRELLELLGGAAVLQMGSACAQPSEAPPAATSDSKSASQDLDFASAWQAAEAIRNKRVSSVELTRRTFERIDRVNPQLNAFTYQLREAALAQANKADGAQSRGESLGVFHGVPVHVKESFGVAGYPCTWGLAALRDSKAPRNSHVVERLLGAGAVLIGATNVPVQLLDWQSYNPIYGTTNNPWDVKRTPGGSSGGTAAALAAGLGYLSAGSDIGGSIRVPAHFCGVYGHKPTLDLVSTDGHQPGGAPGLPGFSSLLAVAGPMARSADDLLAALKVMGGPAGSDAKAWKWNLPASRAQTLKAFRVGYVLDDPSAPPVPEIKTMLEQVIETLGRAGATLKPGWPTGYRHADLLSNYVFHLWAFLFSVSPPEEQKEWAKFGGANTAGLTPFARWQTENIRRLEFRAQWQSYFDEVDVFLSPVAYAEAFPHDHSEPQEKRTIATSSGTRRYMDLLNWISPASLTGCPATATPVGRTKAGLPVGIQIMGPFWEDATPITFAQLLGREIGGFAPAGA
jgi:amidase